MSKKALFFILLSTFIFQAQAQVFSPLDADPGRKAPAKQPASNLRITGMSLPFFDDFSKSTGNPDPAKWEQTGGALISNRFAKDPISINVATLDGLDANGRAYNFLKTRPTDSLISKPINLSGLQNQNVVLSFYWQAGGISADVPNNSGGSTSDFQYYLRLEFRKQNGTWTQVWQQDGTGQSTPFNQVLIALTDPDYFYADFQFRFITRGEAGMRDNWNVDYVKLDANRSTSNTFHSDVAISHSLNTFLNGYTAIPAFEFRQNPAAKLGNTVETTYNNLMQSPLLISAYGYSQLLTPATAADTFYSNPTIPAPATFQNPISGSPSLGNIPQGASRYLLKYSMFLKTNSPNQALLYNDTVSRTLEFSDYFAYDDGTAETGLFIPPPGTSFRSLATSFEVSKPSVIRAVRIYFTNNIPNSGTFNFKIWADDNGSPSSTTLLQQGIPYPADSNRSKYIEVPLTSPVQVNGRFYVGWSQFSASALTNVGVDLNNKTQGTVFYADTPNNWAIWVDNQGNQLEGSVMIRPVVDEIVGLEEEQALSRIQVYPNPAKDKVFITGQYEQLMLLDISGRKLTVKDWDATLGEMQLPQVPAGVYFLQIQTKNSIKTHKLVITK